MCSSSLACKVGMQLVCFVLLDRLRVSFLTGLKRKQIFAVISSWPHPLAAQSSVGFCLLPGVRLDTECTPRLQALRAPWSPPRWPQCGCRRSQGGDAATNLFAHSRTEWQGCWERVTAKVFVILFLAVFATVPSCYLWILSRCF